METLKEFKKAHIIKVARNSKSLAEVSRVLGVTPKTVYNKSIEYCIDLKDLLNTPTPGLEDLLSLDMAEKGYIIEVLKSCRIITDAARILNISIKTLYNRAECLKIKMIDIVGANIVKRQSIPRQNVNREKLRSEEDKERYLIKRRQLLKEADYNCMRNLTPEERDYFENRDSEKGCRKREKTN